MNADENECLLAMSGKLFARSEYQTASERFQNAVSGPQADAHQRRADDYTMGIFGALAKTGCIARQAGARSCSTADQ